MWQLKEATLGIRDACLSLGVPVVSGNVSLYNETSGASIHPTPTIGMVGVIEDVSLHTTQWFKKEGDLIALIGGLGKGLGGSEYLKVLHGLEKGLPRIDLEYEKRVQDACREAIKAGIILSCHDCSEGGLAVAIAECCMNPMSPVGAEIKVDYSGLRPDEMLFGEAQSRFVVSLGKGGMQRLKQIASAFNAPVEEIGVVAGDVLSINNLVSMRVEKIKSAWADSFERVFFRG
jgi:phosphoribosylformylglycinamidine synthase